MEEGGGGGGVEQLGDKGQRGQEAQGHAAATQDLKYSDKRITTYTQYVL